MNRDDHHRVLANAMKQLADVFDNSKQCIYLYLDDMNKACNERFAKLLGYKSPEDWAAVTDNFPEVFVSPNDRMTLVATYQKAVNDLEGSMISIGWLKKDGKEIASKTILVPISFEGHRMALHFITPV